MRVRWRPIVWDIFDPVGDENRVFRALVGVPRSTVESIRARTGLPDTTVRNALETLRDNELVAQFPDAGGDVWEAQPPDLIVADRIKIEEQRLAELRGTGEELSRLFRTAHHDGTRYPGLEVVHDRAAIITYFGHLQASARRDIKAIDRPPYLSGGTREDEQVDRQTARMAAGIRYRVIYHDSIYADALRCANVMRAAMNGEQSRVLVNPPVKLLISDDERALVALDPAGSDDPVSLLVHPSALLNALVSIFDTLWRLAVPLSPEPATEPLEDRDRAIITLMAAGATDETIARRLNMSRRSVVRRTSALLERLGATTRFQAGVQAARRGWL
jgi:DNA-binding NarL/FixJ family response regulator